MPPRLVPPPPCARTAVGNLRMSAMKRRLAAGPQGALAQIPAEVAARAGSAAGFGVADMWEQTADARGGSPCLLYTGDAENGFCESTLSFEQVDRLANQVAHWGAAEGLRKGDTVALVRRRMRASADLLPSDLPHAVAGGRAPLSSGRTGRSSLQHGSGWPSSGSPPPGSTRPSRPTRSCTRSRSRAPAATGDAATMPPTPIDSIGMHRSKWGGEGRKAVG